MPADAPGQRALILLRHAKAEKDGPSDSERALSDSGRRDASLIGRAMQQAGVRPERVLVSPALRTRQTWQLAAAELDSAPPEQLEPAIFDNDVEDLLQLVRETPDEIGTLMLVGHNPSIEELAATLDDGAGHRSARRRLSGGFSTGAFAVLTLSEPWQVAGRGGLRVQSFGTPKGLR